MAPDQYIVTTNSDGSIFVCYRAIQTTSSGIFVGDKPLQASVPLLLSQTTTIFAATRITHALLRPIGFPEVVSHVIAGIILGPTFLSRNEAFRSFLFPQRGYVALHMLGLLSLLLFVFGTGVKTELGLIYKSGTKPVVIAFVGTFLPFGSVLLVDYILRGQRADKIMVAMMSARWALTSNTVLAALLVEFNLLSSKLGRLAMSAALMNDLWGMFAQTIMLAVVRSMELESVVSGLKVSAVIAAFFAVVVFVARPLALWMIRRTPEGEAMDDTSLFLILMLVLGLGLAGEVTGQHATVGPMLLGLLMPGGAPLGTTLAERVERLVLGFFLPVFIANTGINADMRAVVQGSIAGYVAMLFGVSVASKLVSLHVCCFFCRMPFRDAVVLSLMMCCKGIVDISTLYKWRSFRSVQDSVYAVNMIGMVVVGGATAALLKHLYKPSIRYVAYRRRTIQHSRRNQELRLLICIHNSDNVAPILTLLEVSHLAPDSPICVYLLRLSPLAGRTAPILAPYQQKKVKRHHRRSSSSSSLRSSASSSSLTSEIDQIVNAFRHLEQHRAGGLVVLPFNCIAPYAAMHDDICNAALEKNVTLIVLPFHKHVEGSAAVQSAIQEMNLKVLSYAPCSVAILVDHGLARSPSGRVAVFFLGGADDREALAYAARIAENRRVGITVLRFLPIGGKGDDGGGNSEHREEVMDNEAVEEFQTACMDGGRVEYREEFVEDGTGTVAVIRDMCGDFSLLIVGRRERVESSMTKGMEAWSEYPELGLVGDTLASSDFGAKVSTLVVQQQKKVVG